MALSSSHEDYLRAIWKLAEWQDHAVTSGELARALGLSPSTVSEGVQRLVGMGLVRHARYGKISLTPEGRSQAARMVRIHRLLETALVTIFGYSWDEVHDEAEQLEHAVSDLFIARLDAALGHPTHDPHGDVIPMPDGSMPEDPSSIALSQLTPGREAVIHRVADSDSQTLKELSDLGLVPGERVHVANIRTGLGLITLAHADTSTDLSISVARNILVTTKD